MIVWSIAYQVLKIQGLATPYLAVDVLLILALVFLSKNLILPLLRHYKRAKQLDEIAGATPRHWFYGHAREYSTNKEGFHKALRRIESFPAIFNRWIGPFMSVLETYHPDSAIALLSSGAPKNNLGYRFIRPWIGDGLLTSKGKKWQRNRHLLTPAFHFTVLKGYTQVFNESAKIMLDKWENKVGEPVEVSEDVSLLTLDTMLKCAMSSHMDCQNAKNKNSYTKAVQEMGQIVIERFNKPHLFPDFIFYRTELGKRFKAACDTAHQYAENVIAERKQQLLKSKSSSKSVNENDPERFHYGGKQRLDFLDILLQTRDEEGKGLSDPEIRDEVDTFLFEGHDTTASGIFWAIYNLAKYPEYQEKCRQEVNFVLEGKETVDWNDFSKFQYLTMFIKENMRLYPPVLAIGRELKEPMTIKSFLTRSYQSIVPKETNVTLFNIFLHRNPLLWENPEEFNPERFTKENISKRSTYSYLPFSAGSRNCIGQNFAMNEMKTVLALTVRKYRLYLDEETPTPEIEPRLTLQSKHGVFVKFERIIDF